ncbi:MAG: hypothetical protein ABI584_12060 [Acidobacteriota bacterium]
MRLPGAARAFVAAAFLAGRTAAEPITEHPLPAEHPCLLEDERFARLHEERGVWVGLARQADGSAVLRARAALAASPARVTSILADVARWPSWIRGLRTLTLLPGDPPAFAAVFAAPWPLRDRAYALLPATARGPASTIVFWEDGSSRLEPASAGRVRVAPVGGCFAVTPGPAEGGATLVYTERDVFGESLPGWMRSAARTRGPVRLVDGLRARLGEN